MGWNAVQESWRQERPGWVAACGAATTDGAVSRCLLQLEAKTRWSAVGQAWREIRPGWVASLGAID